jgi:hypothetical protein
MTIDLGCEFLRQDTGKLLKPPSESFDGPQDERWGLEMVGVLPFMLRVSKHS